MIMTMRDNARVNQRSNHTDLNGEHSKRPAQLAYRRSAWWGRKIHTIFEGTSEIQQLVISRAISGMRIE